MNRMLIITLCTAILTVGLVFIVDATSADIYVESHFVTADRPNIELPPPDPGAGAVVTPILDTPVIPDQLTEIKEGDVFWLTLSIVDRRRHSEVITSYIPSVVLDAVAASDPFSSSNSGTETTGIIGMEGERLLSTRSVISIQLVYNGKGNTQSFNYRMVDNSGNVVQDTEFTDTIEIDEAVETVIVDPDTDLDTDPNNPPNTDDKDDNAKTVTQPDPDPLAPPVIMLKKVDYGTDDIVAGESFRLVVTSGNMSSSFALEDVVVTLELPDEITLVANSAPSNFYNDIGIGGDIVSTFDLSVKQNVLPDTLNISVKYTAYYRDIDNEMENISQTHEVGIPIKERERFSISDIDVPSVVFVGGDEALVVSVLNKGITDVSNISVVMDIDDTGVTEDEFQWVGNLKSGTEDSVRFTFDATEPGIISGDIIVTYEDSSAKEKILTQSYSVTVRNAQVVEVAEESEEDTKGVRSLSDAQETHEITSQTPVSDQPMEENSLFEFIAGAIFISGVTIAGFSLIYNMKNSKRRTVKRIDKTTTK